MPLLETEENLDGTLSPSYQSQGLYRNTNFEVFMSSLESNIYIQSVSLNEDFTVIPNSIGSNTNLSFGAMGLLLHLLQLPKNWKIHTWQLAKHYQGKKRGNGLDSVKVMMRELKDEGYIVYEKIKNEKGLWDHRYIVYPFPIEVFKKMFPERFKPAVVKPSIITNTKLGVSPIYIKKQQQEKGKSVVVFSCLKDRSDLTDANIKSLMKYPEERVKLALEFSKFSPPKKSLIQLLIWHCNMKEPPVADESSAVTSKEENIKEAKILQKKFKSKNYTMECLSKYVEFTPHGHGVAHCLNYDEKGFSIKLNKLFEKFKV